MVNIQILFGRVVGWSWDWVMACSVYSQTWHVVEFDNGEGLKIIE